MTDTFRDLCAELLAAVEHEYGDPPIDRLALSQRARAALAEGAGVGPHYFRSEAGYQQLDDLWCEVGGDINVAPLTRISFANALLARYGTTHPRPIPVAERLPTEADCDDLAMCWWYDRHNGAWARCDYAYAKNHGFRHWLPAAAIPLPEATP